MTKVAISVARYSRFFIRCRVDTVLDYGAGTLRNALYLVEQGFTVYAADLPEQVKVLRSHPGVQHLAGVLEAGDLERSRLGVDLVLSTYVFNIITHREQRQRYLENVVANLRPGGFFLMEVCCRREELECGSAFLHYLYCDNPGRTYTHEELDRVVSLHGFQRVCHYYTSHAVAVIYQLAGGPGQSRIRGVCRGE
jgi:tellurite methyltransferase